MADYRYLFTPLKLGPIGDHEGDRIGNLVAMGSAYDPVL